MQEHTIKAGLILNITSTRYSGDEIAALITDDKKLNLVKRNNAIYFETISLTINPSNNIDLHIENLKATFSDRFLLFDKDYEKIYLLWMPVYEDKLYNLMVSNQSLKYLADMGMSLQAPYFYKPQ